MAINYTKIGWDTSKYVNPTNMNQMDNGIKAACDAIDSEVVKLTASSAQTIKSTAAGQTALAISSGSTANVLLRFDSGDTPLGFLGVSAGSNKPIFYDSSAHEIALADNVIAKSSDPAQTITNTRTGQYVTLFLKSSYATSQAVVGFQDVNSTTLGYLGVNADKKPVFLSGASGSTMKEIALKEDFGAFNSGASMRACAVLYRNAVGGRVYVQYLPTTKTPVIDSILDEGSDTDIKSNFTISNNAGLIYFYTWVGSYDGHVLLVYYHV